MEEDGKGKGKEPMSSSIMMMDMDKNLPSNVPWVEKYRPDGLDDVVHHGDIITTLRRFLKEGRLPHLLFYGPPGTGKTSTAVAMARDVFGTARGGMVLELNASDERGIAVVREQIKTFAATRTLSVGTTTSTGMRSRVRVYTDDELLGMSIPPFKLIILDECDAMTSAAQNALRRVMEKYVKNVRFILICNYVGQIIPALQSRCTRFRFGPLPREALMTRIGRVEGGEGVKVEVAAKEAIIRLAGGDMRRILNVLQAAAASAGSLITEDSIYAVTAAPHPNDLDRIFKMLLDQTDLSAALTTLKQLQLLKGLALMDILQAMFERLSQISITNDMRVFMTKHLAEIEYQLARGSAETLQLPALVGAFFAGRTFLSTSHA